MAFIISPVSPSFEIVNARVEMRKRKRRVNGGQTPNSWVQNLGSVPHSPLLVTRMHLVCVRNFPGENYANLANRRYGCCCDRGTGSYCVRNLSAAANSPVA